MKLRATYVEIGFHGRVSVVSWAQGSNGVGDKGMESGTGPGEVVYIMQMSSLEVKEISFWALIMATEFLFI